MPNIYLFPFKLSKNNKKLVYLRWLIKYTGKLANLDFTTCGQLNKTYQNRNTTNPFKYKPF